MASPSTFDRLPAEIRAEFDRLLADPGFTLDQFVGYAKDRGYTISRSAAHRREQTIEKAGQKLRRSREISEALMARIGDKPESQTARLNIELLHSAIFDLTMAAAGGGEEDGEGSPVVLDTEQTATLLAMLSGAVNRLTAAAKADADMNFRIRAEVKRELKEEMKAKIDEGKASGDLRTEAAEEALRYLGFAA